MKFVKSLKFSMSNVFMKQLSTRAKDCHFTLPMIGRRLKSLEEDITTLEFFWYLGTREKKN